MRTSTRLGMRRRAAGPASPHHPHRGSHRRGAAAYSVGAPHFRHCPPDPNCPEPQAPADSALPPPRRSRLAAPLHPSHLLQHTALRFLAATTMLQRVVVAAAALMLVVAAPALGQDCDCTRPLSLAGPPVCGTNGLTYQTRCLATCQGISVAAPGACGTPGKHGPALRRLPWPTGWMFPECCQPAAGTVPSLCAHLALPPLLLARCSCRAAQRAAHCGQPRWRRCRSARPHPGRLC